MGNQTEHLAEKHPDYKHEQERLLFTRLYIDQVVTASKKSEGHVKEKLKQAYETLDSLDSSLSYMNLLTGANLLQMTSDQTKRLEAIYGTPYFARIDYQKEGDVKEELYIGKASLHDPESQEQIIVDWRSPVANVYYDGRLGEVEYDVGDEQTNGYLSLKRQYKIEDGTLHDIRDVDLTTTDELLQESLAGKADNRLTEIVSTIQKEQNDIIRAPLNRPIIVQGAAGSGKTTIALHRISYFLYTNSETFYPRDLMILAPNQLFIKYISTVLPDLGVEKIHQTTLIDYMKAAIGKPLKIVPPTDKLLHLVEHPDDRTLRWLSAYKGSLPFLHAIDRYLEKIEHRLAPQEDVMLEKFRLLRGNRLRQLFLDDYSYLPVYRRFEKIKGVVQNHVRTKKKVILKKIEDTYEDALEKALYGIRNDAKRKRKVTHLLDTKNARLEAIKKEARTTASRYMRSFAKESATDLYKTLLTSDDLLQECAPELSATERRQLIDHSEALFNKRSYELEDLAPIYYVHGRLYGLKEEHRARSVFIDEAQDYSHFQLMALRRLLETSLFTIVGDLAQGIHSYRGTTRWEPVLDAIFPEANYFTLQKSYRTTIEIMNAANELLRRMPEALPQVEPVVRHGPKPMHRTVETDADLTAKLIADIQTVRNDGYHTLACIGRTTAECKKLARLLKDAPFDHQLVTDHDDFTPGSVSILPSHLSKGLEFDAVMIPALTERYAETELDVKLLYVAMTRAMHQLYLYSRTKEDLLLHHMDEALIRMDEGAEVAQ